MYYSLILAQWFKQVTKSQGHQSPEQNNPYIKRIDSGDLTNLVSKEPYDKQDYFQQYQKSFKDGEYNLTKPTYTPYGQSIRRYMSGGMMFGTEQVSSAISKVTTTAKKIFPALLWLIPLTATTLFGDDLPNAGPPVRLHYEGEVNFVKNIGADIALFPSDTPIEINALKYKLLDPESRRKYSENERKDMLKELMEKTNNDEEKIEFLKEIRGHSDIKSEVIAWWYKSLNNLTKSPRNLLPDAAIELKAMDLDKEKKLLNDAISILGGDDRVNFIRDIGLLNDTRLINSEVRNRWLKDAGDDRTGIPSYSNRRGSVKDMYSDFMALVLAGKEEEGVVIKTDEAQKALQNLTKVLKEVIDSGTSPDYNPQDWLNNLKKNGMRMNPVDICDENYFGFDVTLKDPNGKVPSFGKLLISAALNMNSEQRKKFFAHHVSKGDPQVEEDWVKRLMNMPSAKEGLWDGFSTALLLKLEKIIGENVDLINVLRIFLHPEFENEARRAGIKDDESGKLLGMVLAADWNIRNFSIENTAENISKVLRSTGEALKNALSGPDIFTKDIAQAIFVHSFEDPAAKAITEEFKRSAVYAGVAENIIIENNSQLKSQLLQFLLKDPDKMKKERVIVFTMHGEPNSLGNGQGGPKQSLSRSDLAEILDTYDKAGGDLPKLTLFIISCSSQTFTENTLRVDESLLKEGHRSVSPGRVFFFSDGGSVVWAGKSDMAVYFNKDGQVTTKTLYDAQTKVDLSDMKPSGLFFDLEKGSELEKLGKKGKIPNMVRGFIGSPDLYDDKAYLATEKIRKNKHSLKEAEREKVKVILEIIKNRIKQIDKEKVKAKLLQEVRFLTNNLKSDAIVTFSPGTGIISKEEYILGAAFDNTIALIDGFFNYPALRDNNDYLAEMLFHEILAKCFPEESHSDHKARYVAKALLEKGSLENIPGEESTPDLAGIQRDLFGEENLLGKALKKYLQAQLAPASSAVVNEKIQACIDKITKIIFDPERKQFVSGISLEDMPPEVTIEELKGGNRGSPVYKLSIGEENAVVKFFSLTKESLFGIELEGLKRGKNHPLFQQLITSKEYADMPVGYIVTEFIPGKSFSVDTSSWGFVKYQDELKRYGDMLKEEFEDMLQEHWEQLVLMYLEADELKITIDANPANFKYDKTKGFTALDYFPTGNDIGFRHSLDDEIVFKVTGIPEHMFGKDNELVDLIKNNIEKAKKSISKKRTLKSTAAEKTGNKETGGIAFNALPIQTESVASSALGSFSGVKAFQGNLDAEWGQIQAVFNAGIRPSVQRISEYTAAAASSGLAGEKIDQVRSMLADILRRDEEAQKLASVDPALKGLLSALEAA